MNTEQQPSSRGAVSARHSMFVIGRIRKGEQKLIFLHPATRPVFPGPWQIRAVLVD
jgi:hypothetical protein